MFLVLGSLSLIKAHNYLADRPSVYVNKLQVYFGHINVENCAENIQRKIQEKERKGRKKQQKIGIGELLLRDKIRNKLVNYIYNTIHHLHRLFHKLSLGHGLAGS